MKLKKLITNWNHPSRLQSDVEIDRETILKLISAAHWAPSAENEQVWKFFVINEERGKKHVIKAIKQQDPRLTSNNPSIKKPEFRLKFKYSTKNFNAESDKYKDWISSSHKDDLKCAQNSTLFIIYMHSKKVLGEAYGQTDVGASIINTILCARNLGYDARWIRNFDRSLIEEQFTIPKDHFIDGILALGINERNENRPEIQTKEFSDFYYLNGWNNKIDLSQLKNQGKVDEYDVDTIDAILDRRSIRDFKENKSVPKPIIYELIEAGMMPPLITNNPYIKLIVVDDPELLKTIADNSKIVLKQKHVQQVPLLFVITYDCSNNSPAFYAEVDTGAILQTILLRAHSLGIGSCWIGAFNRRITKKILDIPDNWYIPTLAIFGYPNDYPQPTPRKDLGKICYINQWENNIQKRKRTLLPSSHIFSILLRRIHDTRKKTILRDRKVGKVRGIPEFKEFI